MTLVQIYQVLLIKEKKKLLFCFLILINCLNFPKILYSQNIQALIRINNSLITNIDVNNEIKFLEIQLENKKLNTKLIRDIAIKNLIEIEIKKLELKKYNIVINQDEKNLIFNSSLSILTNQDTTFEKKKKLKEILLTKIETNLKWSSLIKKLYLSNIEINLSEINEISKKNKLNNKEKEELILNEKKKKLEKFSRSHFLNIKKTYIIKIL